MDIRTTRSPFARRVALVVALASMAPALASAQETPAAETRADRPRVRFGTSLVGGGFAGAVHGGVGGIAPRIGVQFTDVVGVYLQAHWMLGAFDGGRLPNQLAGFAFHEAMFELTAIDLLQFGVGPSLDFVFGCSADNGGAACAGSDPHLGGDFRFAVVLGGHGPGQRGGISLSADVHPTFLDPDVVTVALFGIGGELY